MNRSRISLFCATIGALTVLLAPSATAHNLNLPIEMQASDDDDPGLAPISRSVSAPFLGPMACEDGLAGPYPCENVDLESFLPLPLLGGVTGNDIWGWTDPETGREYAVMGTSDSTGFIDVTDPTDPVLVGILPTAGIPDYVLWRDVKVAGNYAYVVSEVSRSGLQVFDLTRLRGSTGPTVFDADANYDEFSYAHNVAVNEQTGFAYAVGSNTCGNGAENGGLHMIDISDPLNPTFAGCATVPGDDNYVHDVECVIYEGPDPDYSGREICVGSNENIVAIYDVTDKSAPVLVSTMGYDSAEYTHQGWLTDDQRWFLFGDELDEQNGSVTNTTTYIMDVADLDNPGVPVPFSHATASIDHNLYIDGNRVYQSNYTAGLRILDFDDESLAAGQLEEVGFFDVVPGVDVAEFAGTWSNYRFPGSGTVVLSAIENEVNGLFVLRPTLTDDNGGGGGGGKGTKPGKGCGDKNHEHEREGECKKDPR